MRTISMNCLTKWQIAFCVMAFFPYVGCISQELVMLSILFKDRIWFNTPFGRGEIIIGKILEAYSIYALILEF